MNRKYNIQLNLSPHANYFEEGGNTGGMTYIPEDNGFIRGSFSTNWTPQGISPDDAVLSKYQQKMVNRADMKQAIAEKGEGFLDKMNSSGGGWAAAIGPAATNIANAFLDTEASTADRVAGALGIPALANQWRADTSKGDSYLKAMTSALDSMSGKNYIQDASSTFGANNAVKLNNKQIISPISPASGLPSFEDFKGNWWRNMGASVVQGAAAGSVGGPWGAAGGALTGLFGSLGGLFGRNKRADKAYKDFLHKRDTIMSAQQNAFNTAVKNQTLSNMQALANGNMSQRINDMANIRAYGGNLYNTKDMGGNLYTDLSPNMMSLWNNKQQIDQQKAMNQQFNLGLGNSFNQKMFADGGDTEDPLYIQGVTDIPLEHRAFPKSLWDKEEAYRRAKEAEFYDRYRKDWGDRTPLYANMTEDEFIRKSNGEGDDPNYSGLPLSDYNHYKYRKYLNYPNTSTFNNAHLFMPDINKLREKYPLSDLPVYKKNGSWYLKEGVPASNGYKNTESGGHKIPQQFLQDTLDELRRRAWTNEFYNTSYDLGDDLPKRIHFQGNNDVYTMRDNGKYINKKGETWDAGDYNDIRQLLKEGQAKDYDEYRKNYLKYKKEQDEKAKKRQEEGHIDDYWHKGIDDNFMTNPIVEHDEIVVTPKSSNSSQNVSKPEKSARQKSYDAFTEDFGGSEGIKNFQEKYNMYHPEAKIKVDGIAGPETVRAFQKWNNEYGSDNVYGLDKLSEDGWYGDKSREYFTSGIAKRNLGYAYGGLMTSPYPKYGEFNKYAEGGSVEYPQGTQYYANGGTHEENPYGGIQVGVDQQGNPNLVEEGEFRWNDFVFSDRINVDANLLSSFNLAPATKHQNKKAAKGKLSYADMAKKYAKRNKELENDPITKNSMEAFMQRLANAQEYQKKEAQLEAQKQNELQDYKTALNKQNNNPMYGTMKYNGMGNAATQQGVNSGVDAGMGNPMSNADLSNVNRSGNEMMAAYGGNLFAIGGGAVNPYRIIPEVQNVNNPFSREFQDQWTLNHAGPLTPSRQLFSSSPTVGWTASTLPDNTLDRQQLLVNEGYDIGNTGAYKNGVDDIWGNKSKAAWDDFNLRRQAKEKEDYINAVNNFRQQTGWTENNLNLGVRDGDAITDVDNLGEGQTSYGNAVGNTDTSRSNLTGTISGVSTDTPKKTTTNTNPDAAIPSDPKEVPLYSTAGKYAQFGKGIMPMIWDWANKTNVAYDPYQRDADRLEALANEGPSLRTADTIGGYRAPNLMDVERLNNSARAEGIAQMQAILDAANGNRGFVGAQSAQNNYNTQMGIGNNYVKTQEANNANRLQTDQLNHDIDVANQNAINTMRQDNQRAEQTQHQAALSGTAQAAALRQRERLHADEVNTERMKNRAANQAAYVDNALNYFTTQAMENQELNTRNNDPTNPYWVDKNGVTHYTGDSGLNQAIRDAFGNDEYGRNGTFTGERLEEWNDLTKNKKYSAKYLKEHPELWQHLVTRQREANKIDAEKAEQARMEELEALRGTYQSNLARLNALRDSGAIISDPSYNLYTGWAGEDYSGNQGLLRTRNQALDQYITQIGNNYDRYLYEKQLAQNQAKALGGYLNAGQNNNNNYYSYTRI